jgi:DinB superfamily
MTSRPRLSTASSAPGAQGAKAPERARLLDRFADFPAQLRAAGGAADRTPPDGEWSSEQVVRHLIAVEMRVHQARLLDVAVHDAPAWSWTEPGPWDGEPDLDLDGVLTRFAELRAATVARIRALDDDGWRRTGEHATYGMLDVAGLLRLATDHDAEHLRSLETR